MKDTKNDFKKKILYCLPFLIYAGVMIFYHVAGYFPFEDDIKVAEKMKDTFWELLVNMKSLAYEDWSSRVLINPLIWMVSFFDMHLWMVMDIIVIVFTFYAIKKLCFDDCDLKFIYILMLILLLFPFYIEITAGWTVTTMTYLWPLAAAVVSCFTIKNYLKDEKTGILQYIVSIVMIIFATNKEELSVMMFILFLTMLLISIKEKKVSYIFFVQCVISLASIFFHLTSTGNQERAVSGGRTFSILDSVDLGFVSTIVHSFDDYSFNTLWFCIFLLIGVVVVSKKVPHILISSIPLLVWIINCFGTEKQFFGIFNREEYYVQYYGPLYVSEGKYKYVSSWLQLLIGIILIASIVTSIVFIFGKTKQSIILTALLAGGFAGRMTASFGEYGWMPFARTFTFFYMSMLIVIMFISHKVIKKLTIRKQDLFIGLLILISMLQIAINVIYLGIVDIGLE